MDQQVTYCHMYVNHLIMNYKSTFTCQIACIGVSNLQLTGLPQAGRLRYHLTNWSGPLGTKYSIRYLIGFVMKPHQQSAPNPPHYFSEQTSLIHEELMKLLQKQAIQQLEYPVEEDFWFNICIPSSQEGQTEQGSDKFQSPQPICQH